MRICIYGDGNSHQTVETPRNVDSLNSRRIEYLDSWSQSQVYYSWARIWRLLPRFWSVSFDRTSRSRHLWWSNISQRSLDWAATHLPLPPVMLIKKSLFFYKRFINYFQLRNAFKIFILSYKSIWFSNKLRMNLTQNKKESK